MSVVRRLLLIRSACNPSSVTPLHPVRSRAGERGEAVQRPQIRDTLTCGQELATYGVVGGREEPRAIRPLQALHHLAPVPGEQCGRVSALSAGNGRGGKLLGWGERVGERGVGGEVHHSALLPGLS
eukprot:1176233-Prorocentrum_minimum.AAC.1